MAKWYVSAKKADFAAIGAKFGIDQVTARIIRNRGVIGDDAVNEFLNGKISDIADPALLKDGKRLVDILGQKIADKAKIRIIGDYDIDGVMSTYILVKALKRAGACVDYMIPDRVKDGYGLNVHLIDKAYEDGIDTVVTCDNGIAAIEEIAHAKELGMTVLVTDHHAVPFEDIKGIKIYKESKADAVVNPHQIECSYPYKELCGAAVAWKIVILLYRKIGIDEKEAMDFIENVAFATVGDVMPLTGENRTLIRAGLERLSQSDRPGVQVLLENAGIAGKVLTSTNVAFTLVPRINATGRMGAPERAVRLLISGYEEEAEVLSEEICADNEERRRVEAEIAEAAFADIEAKGYMKDRVVVVDGENWHHGVIGIVASRVTERCGKPCMIISRGETEAKGSGRSIEGFSLFEAICACGDLLIKFGGHPMAAGITLKPENIEAFRKRINQYAAEHFPQMPTQTVTLDCKLNPAALSVSMAQSLTQLEPFGNGNPQPVFGLFNMELSNVTPVGGGGHLRLTLEKNGAVITAMRFNTKPEELPYHIGDKIDLAVQLEAREFRGQPSLTVIVRDMKFAAFNTEKNIASLASFEKWQRGEVLSAEDKNRLYPDRACLAAIYRALRMVNGKETDQVRFVSQFGKDMTLGLFKTALLVFEERGLVHSEIADDTFLSLIHI